MYNIDILSNAKSFFCNYISDDIFWSYNWLQIMFFQLKRFVWPFRRWWFYNINDFFLCNESWFCNYFPKLFIIKLIDTNNFIRYKSGLIQMVTILINMIFQSQNKTFVFKFWYRKKDSRNLWHDQTNLYHWIVVDWKNAQKMWFCFKKWICKY